MCRVSPATMASPCLTGDFFWGGGKASVPLCWEVQIPGRVCRRKFSPWGLHAILFRSTLQPLTPPVPELRLAATDWNSAASAAAAISWVTGKPRSHAEGRSHRQSNNTPHSVVRTCSLGAFPESRSPGGLSPVRRSPAVSSVAGSKPSCCWAHPEQAASLSLPRLRRGLEELPHSLAGFLTQARFASGKAVDSSSLNQALLKGTGPAVAGQRKPR